MLSSRIHKLKLRSGCVLDSLGLHSAKKNVYKLNYMLILQTAPISCHTLASISIDADSGYTIPQCEILLLLRCCCCCRKGVHLVLESCWLGLGIKSTRLH